jgi:ubiquinone/menaquinone biosynthesis C-methylase UbiE
LNSGLNEAKVAVQKYWDSAPCGSREPGVSPDDPGFFRAHARIRYGREPEILSFAGFETWEGRDVLEIGVGMGADFVRFRKAGALSIGIDLSRESLKLACRNAAVNQITQTLTNADAESLPFADEAFDLVYSWGVLHHTPDTPRALDEVYRVLRPAGEFRIMLYHRRSLAALQCYLRYGLLAGRPFDPLPELIARHIQCPGAKAYTKDEIRHLFQRFRDVTITPVTTVYDLRVGRRRFAPRWMLRLVPKELGWFLLISGRK